MRSELAGVGLRGLERRPEGCRMSLTAARSILDLAVEEQDTTVVRNAQARIQAMIRVTVDSPLLTPISPLLTPHSSLLSTHPTHDCAAIGVEKPGNLFLLPEDWIDITVTTVSSEDQPIANFIAGSLGDI